jgi:hypothetical protein
MLALTLLVLIFIQCNFLISEAALGFDTYPSVSTAKFNCLKNAGHSFFIARIYRSLGQVDDIGIQNILTARAAGFSDVDGYIFPCFSTQCYNISATQQVNAALNGLRSKNATVGRIWLDIEIFAWPKNQTTNQAWILEMANAVLNAGYSLGIYTNIQHWKSIVGLDWAGVSSYPLWWPKYNDVQDLTTGWVDFGGWKAPTIHQLTGTSNQCGIGFDKNFK